MSVADVCGSGACWSKVRFQVHYTDDLILSLHQTMKNELLQPAVQVRRARHREAYSRTFHHTPSREMFILRFVFHMGLPP